jgi:protein-L-isoaspartate(D-aspartate) O-methyltransferase
VAGSVASEFRGARRRLIETLRRKGIADLAVLHAFDVTPRHVFIPSGMHHRAYEDSALPIGNGQTISQPSTHARYLELLRLTGREKVLEIGTGSGYQTALLSQLAARVFSVERVPALADRARDALGAAGARNVSILVGDGTLGWPDFAPFDSILVSAGAPGVPSPLAAQLADGGRMLIPLGGRDEQTLALLTRTGPHLMRHDVGPARFVPLIGAHGWPQQAR